MKAVGLLGYTVIHSDKASGQLSFNTGRSMSSWSGQDLTATVVPAGAGSQLIMGGSIARGGNPFGGGSQLGSWGEKGRLIKTFVDTVTEVLPSIPKAQTQSQTKAQAKASAPAREAISVADELAKLAKLRDEGVLTPDEFAAQKAKLLR